MRAAHIAAGRLVQCLDAWCAVDQNLFLYYPSRRYVSAGLRALIDGTVGKIKDFFVLRSQYISYTGSAPITTHNIAFTKNAIGLVIRRLPQPLYGTGAVAHYAEMGNFGMRVVMSYQPNTLAQQFTVDVLYGCAVLQNTFGVQVNS